MTNENDWFLPKRFGYGAGLPISWQGWATIGLYMAALAVAAILLMPRHRDLFIILGIVATIPLVAISARHTRGGWKWRWGGDV